MPSSSVVRAVLVATALASATAAHPCRATAQLLPTDPTTTTTAPATTVPTTVPTTTTTAPATTTTTTPAITLAPITTKPAARATTTTTAPATTTTLAPSTNIAPGVPDPDPEAPPPSLPPLVRGVGTRVNWAALVSLLGFGIAFAMLALPGILQRRQQKGGQRQDGAAAPRTRK